MATATTAAQLKWKQELGKFIMRMTVNAVLTPIQRLMYMHRARHHSVSQSVVDDFYVLKDFLFTIPASSSLINWWAGSAINSVAAEGFLQQYAARIVSYLSLNQSKLTRSALFAIQTLLTSVIENALQVKLLNTFEQQEHKYQAAAINTSIFTATAAAAASPSPQISNNNIQVHCTPSGLPQLLEHFSTAPTSNLEIGGKRLFAPPEENQVRGAKFYLRAWDITMLTSTPLYWLKRWLLSYVPHSFERIVYRAVFIWAFRFFMHPMYVAKDLTATGKVEDSFMAIDYLFDSYFEQNERVYERGLLLSMLYNIGLSAITACMEEFL